MYILVFFFCSLNSGITLIVMQCASYEMEDMFLSGFCVTQVCSWDGESILNNLSGL